MKKNVLLYLVIKLYFIQGISGSIVLCVSPQTSLLMMDQRNKYAPKGLSTEFVSGQQADPNITRQI